MRSALHERGVDVQVGVKATAVRARDGEVELELETGGPVRGDELLVAVGRQPRTDDLGLETVGLEPGKPIEVDDRMRANDWLYAIGDVNGRVLLTHMGKYQARIAAGVILGKDMRVMQRRRALAAGDLHGPAGGRGGLHARGRARRGPERARRSTCPRSRRPAPASTAATTRPAPRGWWWTRTAAWWWAPPSPGVEVGEWLHAATIAVIGEVPLERLAHAVPSFPTRSEVWLKLLESYGL